MFNLSGFSENLLFVLGSETELFQTGHFTADLYKSLKKTIMQMICMSTYAHVKPFRSGCFKSEGINSDTNLCFHR